MSEYHVEGFVKTITKSGKSGSFTIEVSAPYLFESKEMGEDGLTKLKNKILFVAKTGRTACMIDATQEFKMANLDFTSLLIAKANRLKVRLSIMIDKSAKENLKTESRTDEDEKRPFTVNRLEVL